MKLNFLEKIIPRKKPLPENEKVESSQELIDKEIIVEAKKLGTNLEKLKSEIDEQFGGIQEFKRFFTERRISEQSELATSEISDTKNWIKFDLKFAALGPALIALLAAPDVAESLIQGTEISVFNASDDLSRLVYAFLTFMASIGGVVGIGKAIEDGIKLRKLQREEKKDALKLKMAGV